MPKIDGKPSSSVKRPQLVNRGGAGLLGKVKGTLVVAEPVVIKEEPAGKKNNIVGDLKKLAVDVDILIPDPRNARVHGDRNMEAIKASLSRYGQRIPLLANRRTKIVEAGNGRLAAVKELGWTKVAVVWVDDDDVTAAGYGLADNRTAELASWNFEVVAALDKLMQEAGKSPIGWSLDELEVLRMADWTPPEETSDEFNQSDKVGKVEFTAEEYETIQDALKKFRQDKFDIGDEEELTDGQCLSGICSVWLVT